MKLFYTTIALISTMLVCYGCGPSEENNPTLHTKEGQNTIDENRSIVSTFQQYAGQAVDTTKQYAGQAVDTTKQYAGQAVDATKQYAGQAVDTTKQYAGQAVDTTKQYAGQAVDTTKQYAGQAVDTTKQVIDWASDDLAKAGKWKYKVEKITSMDTLQETLDKLGNDGWECGEPKEREKEFILTCKKQEFSYTSSVLGIATQTIKRK